MTQEEKAKAYDEAIKRAKKEWSNNLDNAYKNYRERLEIIFPELAESEEERIRKEIISHLQHEYVVKRYVSDVEYDRWIAWLEMQGKEDSSIQQAYKQGYIEGQRIERKCWLEKQSEKPTLPKWKYKKDNTPLLRDSIILNKYGCVLKSPSGAVVSDAWVLDYDELAKLPKEEIAKQGQQKYIPKYKIGDYVKNTNYKGEPIYEIIYMDKECYICEYRGKERMGDKAVMHFSFDNPYLRLVQKPSDKVEPKFKVKYANSEYNVLEIKDIAGVTFYGIEDEPNHIDYVKAENCDIISVYAIKENGSPYPTKPAVFSEQKHADKIEPKFHEGEWIIDGQGIIRQIERVIENVTNHTFGYDLVGGDYFNEEYDVRLWTIQDAKDGDMLSSGHLVFIFKAIHGVWLNCHCSAHNDGSFIADSYDLLTDKYFSEVHPATKEQRDLLFQKMKEAGYTFDFDKKELRKIEQNLANSAKTCKDDTLLDLLNKIPSCITVDGIDYHFVLKKTIAYMAFYEGEGEEGKDKIIFWMAGDPIVLLTAMLEKLKEEGLLE